MNPSDISKKLEEMKSLRKKEGKIAPKSFAAEEQRKRKRFEHMTGISSKKNNPQFEELSHTHKKKSKTYKPKALQEYVQYEDEVLEDTDSIKSKREAHYEKTADLWIEQKRALIQKAKKEQRIEDIQKCNTLFPYPTVRSSQKKLVQDINSSINNQKHIIAHAPTGLGKTVASLGPALEYGIRAKKTVFFLTSRHTQHEMATKTLKDIKAAYDINFDILDIVGKKSMCLQLGIENLMSSDFSEFCKSAKKERTCEYYNNTKKANGMVKMEAELFVDQTKNKILSTSELILSCESNRLCPYEVALLKGETAQVIISDYSYVFHPNIREIFFKKLGLELKDCVIVIDEAHNLPDRTKDLASATLTTSMLVRAAKEADKYHQDEALTVIKNLNQGIQQIETKRDTNRFSADVSKKIKKEDINNIVEKTLTIEGTLAILDDAVANVRKEQKRSSIAGILMFLVAWQGDENGFTRVISKEEGKMDGRKIRYACLDPSVVTKKVFEECSSSVIISGTLQPMNMYQDLLGIKEANLEAYENPFPKENALHLIVPKTTTKFDQRSNDQYEAIANECKKILHLVPGNTAIFFPSYDLRNKIYRYLYAMDHEDFILEEPNLTKNEKHELLKKFIGSSLKRKILLGASMGSFGEGVDFPGHLLECVVVVGLPLQKPTLEVQELIEYYNKKFKKGWDYGYFYPSFNTTFQNVGRCIRSETDKGIMIYLDERFAENRYLKFFKGRPYEIVDKDTYEEKIREFEALKKIENS